MLLIGKKKKNHNRFLKKVYCQNNYFFLKKNNLINFKAINKGITLSYKKKKKFKKKKNLKFKNKIYKIPEYSNYFGNCFFTILLEKPSSFSNKIFGICKFFFYLSSFHENYLSRKKIYIRTTNTTSFFAYPLFYGYKLFNFFFLGSFFFFNKIFFSPGSTTLLYLLKKHALVYYLKIKNKKKIYASSAGTYCVLTAFHEESRLVTIKLPSGSLKKINYFLPCIVGRSANIFAKYRILAKASSKFFIKKKKVKVRGVAMNPVDHPNGGRSKVKKCFKSPWGWFAKKNK